MRDVHRETRIQQLSQLGYRVKEMWECEWNHMIQADPQLKQFIYTLDIATPLNPREAFLVEEPMLSNFIIKFKKTKKSITAI